MTGAPRSDQTHLGASIKMKVRRWIQRALVDTDALRRLSPESNLVLRPSRNAVAVPPCEPP